MRALLVSMLLPFSSLLHPDPTLGPVRRWAPVATMQSRPKLNLPLPATIPGGFFAYVLSSSKSGNVDLNLRFRYAERFGSYALPGIGNLSFGLGMRFVY